MKNKSRESKSSIKKEFKSLEKEFEEFWNANPKWFDQNKRRLSDGNEAFDCLECNRLVGKKSISLPSDLLKVMFLRGFDYCLVSIGSDDLGKTLTFKQLEALRALDLKVKCHIDRGDSHYT
jgi:hypothetical protein